LADEKASIPTRSKPETHSFETERPDSPRKRPSTDLLAARRKAKTDSVVDPGTPTRKKAKTIDLRELKSQLSSSNRDGGVGDEQLGQTVANTIMGIEATTDTSTDLTDQISKLTASINEFVNDNDGESKKS